MVRFSDDYDGAVIDQLDLNYRSTKIPFKKARRVRVNPSEKQKILPMGGEPPEE